MYPNIFINSKGYDIDIFEGEGHYSAYSGRTSMFTKLRKSEVQTQIWSSDSFILSRQIGFALESLAMGWRTGNTAGDELEVERFNLWTPEPIMKDLGPWRRGSRLEDELFSSIYFLLPMPNTFAFINLYSSSSLYVLKSLWLEDDI